jgi:hypothetical protein
MNTVHGAEVLKCQIREEAEALFEMDASPSLRAVVEVPRQRTGDLSDPTEALLYSLLRRRGPELVRRLAKDVALKNGSGLLTATQAIELTKESYSFLCDVWWTAGGFAATALIAASPLGIPGQICSLRQELWHEAIRFCNNPESTAVSLDFENNAVLDIGQPARFTNTRLQSVVQADVQKAKARNRGPDLKTSQDRLELCQVLSRELATIKQDVQRHCTVEGLKRRHPRFKLWEHVDDIDLKELVDGQEFMPKAYAESLVLRQYGLASRETLKKDRSKLKKAKKAPPT